MNKKFFIFNLMLLYTFAAIQATDIFTKNGDKIITNKQFIQLGSNSNGPTSSPMDINTYKDYILNTPNKKYQYHVKLGGSSPNMPQSGTYDVLTITDAAGNILLRRWGCDPLYTTKHLTARQDQNSHFIQIPLDDDTFALIFAGWLYYYEDIAGEMIIIIVHKDEATLVFDRPAASYSYTPVPNFSIEFIEEVGGLIDDFGNLQATSNALSTRTKHKIWKEGNMLKYKKWN